MQAGTQPDHGGPPERLADLWWLLAHDERGGPRLGREHLALGLAAAVVGELLTQPPAVVAQDCLMADPVVAHPLADLAEAAVRGIARSPRVWVEWLAQEHHGRTVHDVVARLTGTGRLLRHGRQLVPVDAMTGFAPIGALISAAGSRYPVSDPVRLLAGLALCCGLAPLAATGAEDMVRPLQLLAMGLPRPLYTLVAATDDAVSDLAMRRR
jgi:hypothetical protein